GRGPAEGGATGGAVRGHPACLRLPRVPGPQRETEALRVARGRRRRARVDRVVRDDAGRGGERHLPRQPQRPVLLGRTPGPRPGRGLRRSQGHDRGGSGALADAQPGLRDPLTSRGALTVWPDGWRRWPAERSAILLTGWRPPNGRRPILR